MDDIVPALQKIEKLIDKMGLFAAGFVSYEAAPAFDKAYITNQSNNFPYLWFGFYPAYRFILLTQPESINHSLTWLPTIDRDPYNSAIDQIKNHIAEGEHVSGQLHDASANGIQI